jgi:phage terminase large subunit-like protein
LVSSQGKRDTPITLIITTAGVGRGGICWDVYSYARRVAAGEVADPTFLPVLFEIAPETDWRDRDAWVETNPAIASGFRSLEEMEISAARAEHIPAQVASFERFYLNRWLDGSAQPWLPLDVWDAGEQQISLDDVPVGTRCWCGLDLSSTQDLSCLAVLFEWEDGYLLIPQFFAPADGIRRRGERDGVNYPLWTEQGWLVGTPGSVVDYAYIEAQVHQLAERFHVQQLAVDRWNSTMIVVRLQEAGLPVVLHGQGFASMSAPTKEFEKLVLDQKLYHDSNPVMRWCLGNVQLARDAADNIKPDKARSLDRIDGATAAVMAVAVASASPSGSVYAERPSFLWLG